MLFDNSFELIYITNLLEYLPDDRVIEEISEAYKMLENGGEVYIETLNAILNKGKGFVLEALVNIVESVGFKVSSMGLRGEKIFVVGEKQCD